MARADDPEGALHDYEIAHTFGIYPLEQYLIRFPDGRYHGLAWDTRPKGNGDQRWFHLYPQCSHLMSSAQSMRKRKKGLSGPAWISTTLESTLQLE